MRSWQVCSTGLCHCLLTSVQCSLPACDPLPVSQEIFKCVPCVSGDVQVCARQRIRLECRQPNRKRKVIASSHTGQISFLQREKSRFNFQLPLNSSLLFSFLFPLPLFLSSLPLTLPYLYYLAKLPFLGSLSFFTAVILNAWPERCALQATASH